jgi:hypothetical protein
MSKKIDPDVLARFTGDTPSPRNKYHPWDIDYIQSTGKIHCVPETAAYLYDGYTPRRVSYKAGSRPELERQVDIALKDCKRKVDRPPALTDHVHRVVLHTLETPEEQHELGGTEEHILRRGFGYCNEQSRVLCTMAQIARVPARLLFVRCPDGARHVMTEMYVAGSWGFFDPSFNLYLPVADAYASALDLHTSKPLRNRLDKRADTNPKYNRTLRWDRKRYSDYFHAFALLNYPLIDFPFGVVRPQAQAR